MYQNLKSSILSPSHVENYYVNTSSRNIKLPFPLGKNKQKQKSNIAYRFQINFFFSLESSLLSLSLKEKVAGRHMF